VGNQTAAAKYDVVRCSGSPLTTVTSWPPRSNKRAQLSPLTPAPTTTTRTPQSWQPLRRLAAGRWVRTMLRHRTAAGTQKPPTKARLATEAQAAHRHRSCADWRAIPAARPIASQLSAAARAAARAAATAASSSRCAAAAAARAFRMRARASRPSTCWRCHSRWNSVRLARAARPTHLVGVGCDRAPAGGCLVALEKDP
jgi:hypothetical protein